MLKKIETVFIVIYNKKLNKNAYETIEYIEKIIQYPSLTSFI